MVTNRLATRYGDPFRLYWTSAVLSYLGDGVRATALPLLAVSLTTSPGQVAVVSAAATMPWLIFGLHAGVLVDRIPRVPMMIVLQVVRGLAGLVAVAGVLTGHLGIVGLAVLAAVLGSCEVYYDIASHALLPDIVPADRLQRANSRLVAAEVATFEFAGPALGGLLFAVAAALPIGVDAATFLGSAALLACIGVRTPPRALAEHREPIGRQLAAGVRWFIRSPLIRTLTLLSTSINLGAGGLYAVLALFARQHLGLGPAGFGLLIAVSAIGSFAGGLLAERLTTPTGRRATVLWSAPLIGACFAVIALSPRLVVVGAAMIAFGLVISLFNVVAMSLRQSRTPADMLGRVLGVHRVICWGALPLGALGAGAVGSAYGLRWAIMACALAVLITWLAALPLLAGSDGTAYTISESPPDSDTVSTANKGRDSG
ncbi:MAG TPA: MFS transporter [Actinoplanes sp.]|nr:MFS transporter [Actinoplanes sp.]